MIMISLLNFLSSVGEKTTGPCFSYGAEISNETSMLLAYLEGLKALVLECSCVVFVFVFV